jgi:hypothetical protein
MLLLLLLVSPLVLPAQLLLAFLNPFLDLVHLTRGYTKYINELSRLHHHLLEVGEFGDTDILHVREEDHVTLEFAPMLDQSVVLLTVLG